MKKQKILDTASLKNLIGFQPTETQQYILENLKRTNIFVGGRRCGKSYLISYLALRELLTAKKEIWIVAPQYVLAKKIFRYILYWASRHFSNLLKVNVTDLTLTNTMNESRLSLKSADNLTALKGEGLDLLIIDEAGMIPEETFTRYLRANISESRPALGGEKGRLICTGNAATLGSWFHKLYQDQEMKDKFAYHWPIAIENEKGKIVATTNPLIKIEELKEIKRSSPQYIWNSEYLANWFSAEASLFKNVEDNIKEDIDSTPRHGRVYYIGVDLARKNDFSVITVIDSTSFEVVYHERFTQLDWAYQKSKIVHASHTYNGAKVLIDQTGIGDVIVSDLMRANLYVEGYKFTSESKKQIMEKAALFIETGRVQYPNIPILIKELSVYGYQVSTKTGRLSYGAPEGFHDDTVTSLALAIWSLPQDPLFQQSHIDAKQIFMEGKEKRRQKLLMKSEEPRKIYPKRIQI